MFFFFKDTETTAIYTYLHTLSLHDARPIFLIHVTQFTHDAGFAPRLDDALADLVALGLLPPELIRAHELLTRYLVVSRLAAPGAQAPAQATSPLAARACGCPSWDDLLSSYEAARQSVDKLWRAILRLAGRWEG